MPGQGLLSSSHRVLLLLLGLTSVSSSCCVWRFLGDDENDDTLIAANIYTESMSDTTYKATRFLKIYLKDQVFMYFGCTGSSLLLLGLL